MKQFWVALLIINILLVFMGGMLSIIPITMCLFSSVMCLIIHYKENKDV